MPKSGIFVRFHADVRQRFKSDSVVCRARTSKQPHRSITPHHDCFKDGDRKITVHDTLLGKIADLGPVMAAQLIAGAIKNVKMSFDRSHKPEDCLAERGLAGSVWADDANEVSGVDRQRKCL